MKYFCSPKEDCVIDEKTWTCVYCGRKVKAEKKYEEVSLQNPVGSQTPNDGFRDPVGVGPEKGGSV